MKTGFVCPIHDQYVPEGACPWCEPLPAPPAKELESTDALEALRGLFHATTRAAGIIDGDAVRRLVNSPAFREELKRGKP